MAAQANKLLERTVTFPNGDAYERLDAITDFRRDQNEARILYLCRRVSQHGKDLADSERNAEFVMKVKIQIPRPDNSTQPSQSPSSTTLAEIAALQRFRDAGLPFTPHLITSKIQIQPLHPQERSGSDPSAAEAFLPGGYIAITTMTKMPGSTIWDLKFWSLPEDERETIRELFWSELRQIWSLGIEPYDCALRNILWDRETQKCSIIDFEHWNARDVEKLGSPHDSSNFDRRSRELELQRWGLIQRPPPATWAQEWGIIR